MASERYAVGQWVVDHLSADTTLLGLIAGGVWLDHAAQGTPFPFIIVQSNPGTDTNSLGLVRAASELVFPITISAEDETDFNEQAALNRIEALLHGVIKLDAFPRFLCERAGEIDGDSFSSALATRTAGARYRFLVNGEN